MDVPQPPTGVSDYDGNGTSTTSDDTLTQTVYYSYDPFNQLTLRIQLVGTTFSLSEFVYDQGRVVLEFDKSSFSSSTNADLKHRYLWGPGGRSSSWPMSRSIGRTKRPNGEVLWALSDNLGSIRDLVDSNGTLRVHRDFDGFGKVTNEAHYQHVQRQQCRAAGTGYIDEAFAFTGRWFDKASGLQNNLNRWYDPSIGRWLSEDPIGFAGDPSNVYRYAGNAATQVTDPSGLQPCPPILATDNLPDWIVFNKFSTWLRPYLHQAGWYIRYRNGEQFTGTDSQEFAKTLAKHKGQIIDRIIIKGHANDDLISNDDGSATYLSKGNKDEILTAEGDNIADLLKGSTGRKTTITLRGCHSTRLVRDLAKALSNGTTVFGYNTYEVGVPFTLWVVGEPDKYQFQKKPAHLQHGRYHGKYIPPWAHY